VAMIPAPASTADSRTTGTVNVISASSRARLRAEFRSGNYLSVSVFPPSRLLTFPHLFFLLEQCFRACSLGRLVRSQWALPEAPRRDEQMRSSPPQSRG